jgi:peptidoglycan-N-acetylglucosamine deacetylase
MPFIRKLRKQPRTVARTALRTLLVVICVVAVTLAVVAWTDHRTTPAEARAGAGSLTAEDVPPGAVDCRDVDCIALTFDGGPGVDTSRLLDILADERVPATFFLLGRRHIQRYPDVVRRMAAEGHELANHTWTHRRLTELETAEIRWELAQTQYAIEALTGQRPRLMRPPQGRTDAEVSQVSGELGLAQVLWSVTAKDYATSDSALITRRVLEQADRDGVILLHDIYPGTVPAVPGIIDELRQRGFTFVTVSELLAPGTPRPGAVYQP